MPHTTPRPDTTFVNPAIVAAKISEIGAIARRINMVAMNAQVVSARVGQEGRSLAPLTQFIGELSDEVGKLIENVDAFSMRLSRRSLLNSQAEKVAYSLEKAQTLHNQENLNIQTLNQQARHDFVTSQERLKKELAGFLVHLSTIYEAVRPTGYIAINCRIEASRIPDFTHEFQTVSSTLMAASDEIQQVMDECLKLIHQSQNDLTEKERAYARRHNL